MLCIGFFWLRIIPFFLLKKPVRSFMPFPVANQERLDIGAWSSDILKAILVSCLVAQTFFTAFQSPPIFFPQSVV